MAHSTLKRARAKTAQPSPNPENSPLSLIANRWCKKIKGKRHYFGTYPSTQFDEALAEYNRCKFDLQNGFEKPRQLDSTDNAVADICDLFLKDRKQKIAPRSWRDYKHVIDEYLIPGLGKEKPANEIVVEDFRRVRSRMETRIDGKAVAPKTVSNYCTRARAVINFANQKQLATIQIKHGGFLSNPPAKAHRKHRNEKYAEGADLSRDAIKDVLAIADAQMKAIVLTALGAGLLSVDIAYLKFEHVDLESGMVDYPRRKTEIERRFVLWPEARQAIKQWLEIRPIPHDPENEAYVFLTSFGNLWHNENHRGNPLGREFTKLLKSTGHHRNGISFSALRKSFRTAISIRTKDEAEERIADYICGHTSKSMRDRYRQRYARKKLVQVGGYVRTWLYGKRGAK